MDKPYFVLLVGHLGCFHLGAVMGKAGMYMIFGWTKIFFLLYVYFIICFKRKIK